MEVPCPVCTEIYKLGLPLAKHMVQKGRLYGEHIQWLEDQLGKPSDQFAWRSDKKIATALKSYYEKYGRWPE